MLLVSLVVCRDQIQRDVRLEVILMCFGCHLNL